MIYDIVLQQIYFREVKIMQTANIKEAVHELAEKLSNTATWDDAIYEMTVRKEIEKGMADSEARRVTPVDDVLKEFGIA